MACMMAITYGGIFHDEKKGDPSRNMLKPLCRACHICILLLPILHATNVLEKLKMHPILQYLNLDSVGAFTCLASHLKCDILQPQPIPQINPWLVPAVLPQPVTNFLGLSLGMSTDVIDDCWGILQNYVQKIPVLPLTSGDFQLFKHFGCENIEG